MAVTLHWFLPTTGDSRTDLGKGNAVGGYRYSASSDDTQRPPTLAYLAEIVGAAERLGFEGALAPTSSWCEDGWITTAAIAQLTERLRFLVAVRPGLIPPTLLAQQAATYQRITGGRLLLNVVTGGDDVEQQRFGDYLGKDARYARAGEELEAFRALWGGEPIDRDGEHVRLTGAQAPNPANWPALYLGGSSPAALEVAAKYVDVYLTWGEPPAQVAEKIERVRTAAAKYGRTLRFGIRLHAIARDTSEEAWAVADRLLAGLDPADIARAQGILSSSQSEGQRRMVELHGGRTDQLEVSPNLWAGVGLVRGGAGTALVGSHSEIADRIEEYHEIGIDEFIFSGYPHLEEVYRVGEGVIPQLRRRGVFAEPRPLEGSAPTPASDQSLVEAYAGRDWPSN